MNQQVNYIEGDFVLDDARYALVCSRSNELAVNLLNTVATNALKRHGTELSNIDVINAPSIYQLPIVVQRLAATRRYEAIIALGIVIHTNTVHDFSEYLTQVALKHDIPVINGILTTDAPEQAIEHASTKAADAAQAAIEMVSLLRQIN